MKTIRVEKLGRWLCVAAVVAPLRLLAMPLAETASRYTLSGAIGLRLEDYEYDSGGSSYSRQQVRQELDLAGSGHVWDPRFLRFNIGLNLREQTTRSSQGDSDYSMLGYNVNTTWFGARPNPLTLHASRTRSTIADYDAPAYELETQTAGGRWGFSSELLGAIRLSADRIDNVATGGAVQRDETIENAAVEATKRFTSSAGAASDLNYGYRYNNTTDSVRNTARRQHHLFLSDRTTLSPTAFFNANATYYDRHDVWSGASSTDGTQAQDSRFFSGTASLNLRASEQLRHSYVLSTSRNEINDYVNMTYGGRAGLDYIYNSRWQQHASIDVRRSEIQSAAAVNIQQYTAESGVRYNHRRGDFLLRGGYTLAAEQRYDDSVTNVDSSTIRHTLNLGYARSVNPLWQDNADYRLALYHGQRDSVEHTARYAVTSVPNAHDTVNGVAEVRDFREQDAQGERQLQTQRITLAWTRRLQAMTSLNVSGGHTHNEGSTTVTGVSYDEFGEPVGSFSSTSSSATDRSYLQARLTGGIQGLGNVQYNLLWRHELEGYASADDLQRKTVEGDATYTRGLWQFRLQYRFRETEQGMIERQEQSIVFYGRRRFGARF